MGFKDFIIEYIPFDGEAEDLDNIVSARVTLQLNAKSNSLELFINIYNGNTMDVNMETRFKADEIIKVYAADGLVDKTNSDHLIGIFNILDSEILPDDLILKLTCGDKTYNMLSKLYVADRNEPTNLIIENIIQTINEDGSTATPITTYITSTDSNGDAFESKSFTSLYKNAYDAVLELSQSDYTDDDRQYIFYFDENNHFYWVYPSQTPSVIEFNYNDPIVLKAKMPHKETDAVAMVIYDAGPDKNDNTRLGFYLDPNAGSIKNRMKFQPMTDISRDLEAELTRAGTYATTSNEDYIALLDSRAIARCKNIVSKIGTGLWEANITVLGAKYTPGGLYPVIANDYGFTKRNLRLDRVVHNMDKNGWITTLDLVEDAEVL